MYFDKKFSPHEGGSYCLVSDLMSQVMPKLSVSRVFTSRVNDRDALIETPTNLILVSCLASILGSIRDFDFGHQIGQLVARMERERV